MKKYLFLCMAAIATLLTFSACGDDDEIEPNDINPENVKVEKAKFTETTNQMTLTFTIKIDKFSVPVKITATFQGDQCSSYITEYTYPNDSMAKQAYEANKSSAGQYDTTVYSYKGKVYTEDDTADYRGVPKDEIRQELKMMESVYNK